MSRGPCIRVVPGLFSFLADAVRALATPSTSSLLPHLLRVHYCKQLRLLVDGWCVHLLVKGSVGCWSEQLSARDWQVLGGSISQLPQCCLLSRGHHLSRVLSRQVGEQPQLGRRSRGSTSITQSSPTPPPPPPLRTEEKRNDFGAFLGQQDLQMAQQ